jgi:hypothetical protein
MCHQPPKAPVIAGTVLRFDYALGQWTVGFHMANIPSGLDFQIQACSE